MLHRSLLVAAAIVSIAQAAPSERRDLETYIASTETCITKHRPGQKALATIPSSTRTSCQTVSQTFTTCGTSTITTTVTPEPVLYTTFIDVEAGERLRRRQQTISITITAAAPQTCSTTTTVSDSVSTVYTGEYNGTLAHPTASPLDSRRASLNNMKAPLHKILHRYGQKAFNDDQNIFEVDCLAQETTYLVTTSTIQEEASTLTVTAATPTQYITIENKAAVPITSTVIVDPSSSPPSQSSAQGPYDICTTTSPATYTTTQHLKCAPTNLISSLNNHGIGQTQGNAANSRGLAPGEDPSACCQLCIDTTGCAASENDPDAGNCFLWYTEPECGLGFTYLADKRLGVGEGFVVQSGCGWVEAGVGG